MVGIIFVIILRMKQKIVLITGASSGIGRATLVRLVGDGHVVYGTHRKPDEAAEIKQLGGHPIVMEMTDDLTMRSGVDRVIGEQGRIDVLFNNAGYGLYGSVEETSMDDARHQFEVNLFGLARLTQLVLPHMRSVQSGTIISTSSMGGKMYTPLGAWYHASKHALEGWSDCLRLELKQFGINVAVVEPGGIQTPWGITAADNLERISSQGAYASFGAKVAGGMRRMYENQGNLSRPDVIADVVSQAVNATRPRTRYVAGAYAKPMMFIRKYGGDRLFDWVIMRQFR